MNSNLHKAKAAKNDEFYTQLSDIENELSNYKDHFRNKVVYCNCDDPKESNFYTYFYLNYAHLGLKGLIVTCYKNKDINLFSKMTDENAVYMEKYGPGDEQYHVHYLNGDGDFRSKECVDILETVDIVVTNPPFSLFREYVAQLMDHNKKFLIVGPDLAAANKDIIPFIKNREIWKGVSRVKKFLQPNGEMKSFGNISWFTNLDHEKRHEELTLYRTYNDVDYVKYDNLDAIEVHKTGNDMVKNIPIDYFGLMGVPVSYLDKHNSEHFEIMGVARYLSDDGRRGHIDGREKQPRIIIKRKQQ